MQKQQINIAINVFFMSVILILFYLLFNQKSVSYKVRYVDNVKLFNAFNMSKDMARIYNKKILVRQKQTDSLYAIFQQGITAKQSKEQLKKSQYDFVQSKKKLEELQLYFTNDVSNQVWDRLHTYVKIFSQKEQINLLLGKQGSGSIMYGDSISDVTESAIQFCNDKYENNNEK